MNIHSMSLCLYYCEYHNTVQDIDILKLYNRIKEKDECGKMSAFKYIYIIKLIAEMRLMDVRVSRVRKLVGFRGKIHIGFVNYIEFIIEDACILIRFVKIVFFF